MQLVFFFPDFLSGFHWTPQVERVPHPFANLFFD